MVGHWPGSLAQINVVLSVFLAGISGSSTADAASQSKIFIDARTGKEGYDLSFSIAITAVSAVLAVIIRFSILMIVGRADLDLDRRDVSGRYRAGIADRRAQMATVHVYAVRRGYPTYPKDYLGGDALRHLAVDTGADDAVHHCRRHSAGVVHRDRSACVAVLYSVVLSAFFYRETGARELYKALLDSGRLAGVALFCVGTASAFGWLLAYYKIPQELLANVLRPWGMGAIGAGFFIAFCFLVVGCFLDAIPAIVIVGTVLEPLAKSVDLHPVQFAIISIVSLALRSGDAALWPVPDDRLLDRGRAAALCAEGYGHHAGPDVAGAGRADHLARGLAVPAALDRAGDAEIAVLRMAIPPVERAGLP